MIPPPSSPGIWGLRELICSQYILHEAIHRSSDAVTGAAGSPTIPLVHTPADIYKLLHQGEFGVGHSIGDVEQFGRSLARELMYSDPNSQDPLLEQVSVDGSVFRINLGPYRRIFQGDETNACVLLFQVCLASASTPRGNEVNFLAALSTFQTLNDDYELSAGEDILAFPPRVLDLFLQEVTAFVERFGTVPVLSHSPVYKRFNVPAYRVADRTAVENSALAFLLEKKDQ
jgi:hypothetical protein